MWTRIAAARASLACAIGGHARRRASPLAAAHPRASGAWRAPPPPAPSRAFAASPPFRAREIDFGDADMAELDDDAAFAVRKPKPPRAREPDAALDGEPSAGELPAEGGKKSRRKKGREEGAAEAQDEAQDGADRVSAQEGTRVRRGREGKESGRGDGADREEGRARKEKVRGAVREEGKDRGDGRNQGRQKQDGKERRDQRGERSQQGDRAQGDRRQGDRKEADRQKGDGAKDRKDGARPTPVRNLSPPTADLRKKLLSYTQTDWFPKSRADLLTEASKLFEVPIDAKEVFRLYEAARPAFQAGERLEMREHSLLVESLLLNAEILDGQVNPVEPAGDAIITKPLSDRGPTDADRRKSLKAETDRIAERLWAVVEDSAKLGVEYWKEAAVGYARACRWTCRNLAHANKIMAKLEKEKPQGAQIPAQARLVVLSHLTDNYTGFLAFLRSLPAECRDDPQAWVFLVRAVGRASEATAEKDLKEYPITILEDTVTVADLLVKGGKRESVDELFAADPAAAAAATHPMELSPTPETPVRRLLRIFQHQASEGRLTPRLFGELVVASLRLSYPVLAGEFLQLMRDPTFGFLLPPAHLQRAMDLLTDQALRARAQAAEAEAKGGDWAAVAARYAASAKNVMLFAQKVFDGCVAEGVGRMPGSDRMGPGKVSMNAGATLLEGWVRIGELGKAVDAVEQFSRTKDDGSKANYAPEVHRRTLWYLTTEALRVADPDMSLLTRLVGVNIANGNDASPGPFVVRMRENYYAAYDARRRAVVPRAVLPCPFDRSVPLPAASELPKAAADVDRARTIAPVLANARTGIAVLEPRLKYQATTAANLASLSAKLAGEAGDVSAAMGFLDMVKAREVEATARADTIYRTLVLALVRGAEVQISAWSAERGAFGYADWAVGEPVKDVAGEAQAGDAPVAEAAAAAEGAIAESAAAHDADEPAIVPGPVTNEDLNDWIGKDDPLVLAHAYLLLAYEIFLARLSTPFGKPRPVALRGAVVEPRLGADHPLYRRVWRLVDGESAASDLDHETLHFALRGISLLPRSAPALAALSGTGQPTPQLAAAALVEAFWGVAGGPYNKSNRPADEPWSAYAEVLARAGEWARAAKAVAAGGPAPRVVAGWGAKREGKTPVGCKSYARMVRLWEALPGDKEVTPEELKAAAKGAYGYPFYEAVARQLLVPEELLIPRMGRAVEAQPIFYNQRDKKEAAKEQQGGRVRDDGEKADKEGEAGDWGKRPWGDDRRSTHRRPAGAGREEGSREDGRKEEGRKEEGRRQDGGNRDWRRGRRWQRRDGGEQQGRRDQGADE